MDCQSKLLYETPAAAVAERGRLFLITYHFPPDPAAGALRWEKLARHAVNRGWGVDVITRDMADLPRADSGRLGELSPNLRVFGVGQPQLGVERIEHWLWRLYRYLVAPRQRRRRQVSGPVTPPKSSFARDELQLQLLSLRSWARAYHGWVAYAAHRAWARRTAETGARLFDPTQHRLIVSCGPPHGAHEGARLLAQATGLPFVIDLRDPWSLVERWNEHVASPLTPRIARRHERVTVRQAALVVMNTEPARAAMQALYPQEANRILAIINGYDEDEELPRPSRDGCFRLAYAGNIYLDRNPRNLFLAAARLVRELGLEPDGFAIEFMGGVEQLDGFSIESIARESGLGRFVRLHPPGTRREAAEFLARASMLVNLPQDSHLAIPSKVFEYMRFDAWLLALAAPGSATELLLRGTGADVVAPDDIDGITGILWTRYGEHCEGIRPRALARDRNLSRGAQAERLFSAIDEILERVAPQSLDARLQRTTSS
jgi:glycosyltransferase involved in cell wall biosynthesis